MWNFRNLECWRRAVKICGVIYGVTKRLPLDEKYGLYSQLRRAVVSISSNIAEGCGRKTSKDFINFMYNAIGSLKEVESELFVCVELGYVEVDEIEPIISELEEIGKMISGMINKESSRIK